jgi:hypothetical protein
MQVAKLNSIRNEVSALESLSIHFKTQWFQESPASLHIVSSGKQTGLINPHHKMQSSQYEGQKRFWLWINLCMANPFLQPGKSLLHFTSMLQW